MHTRNSRRIRLQILGRVCARTLHCSRIRGQASATAILRRALDLDDERERRSRPLLRDGSDPLPTRARRPLRCRGGREAEARCARGLRSGTPQECRGVPVVVVLVSRLGSGLTSWCVVRATSPRSGACGSRCLEPADHAPDASLHLLEVLGAPAAVGELPQVDTEELGDKQAVQQSQPSWGLCWRMAAATVMPRRTSRRDYARCDSRVVVQHAPTRARGR
jgi:hypothetical protein